MNTTHEFACLELATDIEFISVENSFNIIFNDFYRDVYTESTNNINNFFDQAIKKIKKIVSDVREKLSNLLSTAAVQLRIKQAENAIKEDPKLAKVETKMVDYEKLDKLNQETAAQLEKTKDSKETENLMKKYRSQRNKILAVSSAITITLAGALIFITKNKNKKIQGLEADVAKSEKRLLGLKNRYEKLKELKANTDAENDKLRARIDRYKASTPAAKAKVVVQQSGNSIAQKGENFAIGVDVVRSKAQAETEIISNSTKDVINNVKDCLQAIGTSKSPIKKVGAVAKATSNSANSIKKLATGEARNESFSTKRNEIRKDIQNLQRRIENAKVVLSDNNKSKEERDRAGRFIDQATRKIKTVKATYRSLED